MNNLLVQRIAENKRLLQQAADVNDKIAISVLLNRIATLTKKLEHEKAINTHAAKLNANPVHT